MSRSPEVGSNLARHGPFSIDEFTEGTEMLSPEEGVMLGELHRKNEERCVPVEPWRPKGTSDAPEELAKLRA